jgi:N-methylhydantoinase A
VYARATLQATHVVPGPAIVEQLDATTVIFPGQEAVVDIYGNLLIHLLRS